MVFFRAIVVLTLAFVLSLSVTVGAQLASLPKGDLPRTEPGEAPAWGLSSDIVYTVFAHDFGLFQGAPGPIDLGTGGFTCTAGTCYWLAGVRLPAGASIRSLELSACDLDAVSRVGAAVFSGPKVPGAVIQLSDFVMTGATPGCSTFSLALPAPHTVDNGANFYMLEVGAEAGTGIQWNQVRIRYRLQVSPAPGTATFGDVPVGHPQRQFIEALVGSGITGGCGGGNYCPDAPVTRGQMAVFLAAALGLHWPL